MLDYLPELLKGLHTSLTLTAASIVVALILALVFTIVLTLKNAGTGVIVCAISPYLPVRRCWWIFLIYYGPQSVPFAELLRCCGI